MTLLKDTTPSFKHIYFDDDGTIKFKVLEDIIYYDGPIISLGLLEDNTPVLMEELGRDKEYGQYSYIFIQPEDLMPLLRCQKSYYDVLSHSRGAYIWKYQNGKAFDYQKINIEQFLSEHGPEKSASLDHFLSGFAQKFEQYLK
jgi:hypothetical protein